MRVSRQVAIVTVFASGLMTAQPVSFQHDIRPVLNSRCVMCHQAQNGGGKLSLASFAGIQKGGELGAAVKPGDPDASPLLQLISGDKPRMPKAGAPLTETQVALIRRWI